MRRFWIGSVTNDLLVDIEGDLFHHICGVCRQEVGRKFELMTSDGRAFFVELIEVRKKSAVAKVLEVREIPALPKPHIHLCVSLPKYNTMDFIVEKSVELGVYSIQPFVSDFSFIKKLNKVSESKQERWKKIVIGATQQSGRGHLMPVEPVISRDELLSSLPFDVNQNLGLFLYEGESPETVKSLLRRSDLGACENIWAFVGSEGGFSHQEVELFSKAGLRPTTLGEQVLRVETACLSIASIIKYETTP